jgi:NDP-sugar pyrophosphorylase family protein
MQVIVRHELKAIRIERKTKRKSGYLGKGIYMLRKDILPGGAGQYLRKEKPNDWRARFYT